MSNDHTLSQPARVLLIPSGDIINGTELAPANTLLRCEHGLKLFHTGDYDVILVTGGRFLPPDRQTVAAGTLMRDWLVTQGVNPSQVVAETVSLDTFENITQGVIALANAGYGDPSQLEVTVVTQWQHAWRFWISFRAMYGLTIKREPLHYSMTIKQWIMEFAMIAYHMLDRHGVGTVAKRNREQRQRAALGR